MILGIRIQTIDRWMQIGVMGLLIGCLSPPGERVALDRQRGQAILESAALEIRDGLAAVRRFEPGQIELWAQAPVLRLDLTLAESAPSSWTLTVSNAMPRAELRVDEPLTAISVSPPTRLRSTQLQWTLNLSEGAPRRIGLTLAPPDADRGEPSAPFRFAVLSDIQDAVDTFQDIVEKLNEDEAIRFVVSTGDLVESGERAQLERFQRELRSLNRPLFSTVGNHEFLAGHPPDDWAELFGRFSFHWAFRGVHYSFIDSASATVHPTVYDWLGRWLDEAADAPHIVVTHIPPFDPIGTRSGAFASRKEAAKLIGVLGRGDVDVTFYGHIHSYYAFSNGHIPAFISGGGGAIPERLDGMGRHFLTVDVSPTTQRLDVSLTRVD